MRHFAVLVEASGLPGALIEDVCDTCGFFTTAFVSAENAEGAGQQALLAVKTWFARSFPEHANCSIEPLVTIEEISEIAELPSADAVRGATWFAEERAIH